MRRSERGRKPYDKQHRIQAREFVYARKAELGCSRCPERHPACLDFHHIDQSEKAIGIARASTIGWPIRRIEQEMAKCIVLCSNCHRKEHGFRSTEMSSRLKETEGTMIDTTIGVFVRGDGRVVITQEDQEISLSAAQVMTLTETFCDLIERAIHDDAEVRTIDPDTSGMN